MIEKATPSDLSHWTSRRVGSLESRSREASIFSCLDVGNELCLLFIGLGRFLSGMFEFPSKYLTNGSANAFTFGFPLPLLFLFVVLLSSFARWLRSAFVERGGGERVEGEEVAGG